jgi:hypothetical protein
MIIWHVLNSRRRIFPSQRHSLPFFESKSGLMFGAGKKERFLGHHDLNQHVGKYFQ